jgi:hemolysin III
MTLNSAIDKYRKNRKQEEIANSLSHGLGILLAIAGLVVLLIYGANYGDAWYLVGYSIFGGSMILLYTASTLYHSATKPRRKYYLHKFDHSAIYILIAGSYTPVLLTALRGPIGWVLFGLVWALAIAGMVYKIWFYTKKWRKLSAYLYIVMGWLIVIAIYPLIQKVPSISLWFLLAGGLSYSLGVIFYIKKHLRFGHLVFHLFVLGGSISHFFAFLYLLPV